MLENLEHFWILSIYSLTYWKFNRSFLFSIVHISFISRRVSTRKLYINKYLYLFFRNYWLIFINYLIIKCMYIYFSFIYLFFFLIGLCIDPWFDPWFICFPSRSNPIDYIYSYLFVVSSFTYSRLFISPIGWMDFDIGRIWSEFELKRYTHAGDRV